MIVLKNKNIKTQTAPFIYKQFFLNIDGLKNTSKFYLLFAQFRYWFYAFQLFLYSGNSLFTSLVIVKNAFNISFLSQAYRVHSTT